MDFQLDKIIEIVSGWFGHKEKKRRVSQLQVDSSGSQFEVKGSDNITVIYNNSPITTIRRRIWRGERNKTHDSIRV